LKIFVTGATGMLGSDLCKALSKKHSVTGLAIEGSVGQSVFCKIVYSDITDKDGIVSCIRASRPDFIIHTAALSDVDYCEVHPEEAFRINAEGAQNVAYAAAEINSGFVYISTDYVFDGKKDTVYAEDEETGPVNVYGASKLDGEKRIQALLKRYFIIRPSWLFGAARINFVDATVEAAKKNHKVSAISDKYACVTYTQDLAACICDLIDKGQKEEAPFGAYHITNAGICSRYEFAREILECAKLEAEIVAIKAKDAGGRALRPKHSSLSNEKIKKVLGYNLRHYAEALKEYLGHAIDGEKR